MAYYATNIEWEIGKTCSICEDSFTIQNPADKSSEMCPKCRLKLKLLLSSSQFVNLIN